MPTLYQLDGSSVVRVLPLTCGVVTIGRGADNDLVLLDGEVSRHHCRLTTTRGRTVAEDLRSRNGTWIAAACLESPTALRDGDQLRIGTAVFVYRDDVCSHTMASTSPSGTTSPARLLEPRRRREEFRFKVRWQFDWSGFAFGWRIRRA